MREGGKKEKKKKRRKISGVWFISRLCDVNNRQYNYNNNKQVYKTSTTCMHTVQQREKETNPLIKAITIELILFSSVTSCITVTSSTLDICHDAGIH